MPKPNNELLTALLAQLQDVAARYDACKIAEDTARRETTNALNALNEIQRRVDGEMQALRQASPTSSDWRIGIAQLNNNA